MVSALLLIWSAALAGTDPAGTDPLASSVADPRFNPGAGSTTPPATDPATPAGNPASGPGANPADAVSEVVVEAPEPRYAAPTLRDRIGRIWAPVLINGRGPYRLVLDTGASHSAIVAQVADSLGIQVGTFGSIRVAGVTGSAIVPSVSVRRMEVGELSMDSTVLPIVADVFGGAQGVLGTEGLGDKRILIDFGHDRVVIRRSRGQLERADFTTLPLRELHNHLLALDVKVGEVRAKAIIDTGAQVSIGNTALRDALQRRGTKDAHKAEIEGVTLDIASGDMIRAPPISVGPLLFNGVNITYGDMFIFERWRLMRAPTLVLGMDVLGSVDVLVIDYRLRQLQLRLRHS
ncbi:MAG TPA: aspartyl protease family protein [Steroidobacteraceae bacterium]|nr:aspartyl protease family protein [Steroidobacteraceae bacterium]